MVFLARYRFMRLVRVEVVLYGVLVAYLGLIGYEIWMLRQLADLHFSVILRTARHIPYCAAFG